MIPVTYDLRTRSWTLLKPITFNVDGGSITVPEGFTCDLASIPRFMKWWTSSYELSLAAPILHDYLYNTRYSHSWTRRDADHLFLQAMQLEGVGRIRRRLSWAAVRLGGWVSWRPSRAQIRVAAGYAAHTMWQTGAAVWLFDTWPSIIAAAGGLSLAKTAAAPYGRAAVARLYSRDV